MLTPISRRAVLGAVSAALLSTGTAEPQRYRVGLMTFILPTGASPSAVPTGWDWAATGPEGLEMLIKGTISAPTPQLAMLSVLGPSARGSFSLSVAGNPPQAVAGADRHMVWSVRSTSGQSRTGTLVGATLGRESAVCLITGADGWSPSLRRSVLSSLEVRRAT